MFHCVQPEPTIQRETGSAGETWWSFAQQWLHGYNSGHRNNHTKTGITMTMVITNAAKEATIINTAVTTEIRLVHLAVEDVVHCSCYRNLFSTSSD